jgi:hypothetical protein
MKHAIPHRTPAPWGRVCPLSLRLLALSCLGTSPGIRADDLFQMPEGVESRVSSFENPNGEKGRGAMTNASAKGNAYEALKAGETKVLLDTKGPGVIQRIWATVSDRSPSSLRALRLRMYWDGSATPAVDAPFGDFFCAGLGRLTAFQSALFSSPEGRSFNCTVPMPFRESARITVTNEGSAGLEALFYDVDFQRRRVPDDMLYFHAFWTRRKSVPIGQDFEFLPRVSGRGRFLGVNMGVNTNPAYPGTWFGEGEVRMYIDGDRDHPTISGTGTEDYIGTGYGEGVFSSPFQGCTISDPKAGSFTFYRLHVPDGIYFHRDFRAVIEELGGGERDIVVGLVKNGAPLRPVSIATRTDYVRLLEGGPAPDLGDARFSKQWVCFYRSDDYCATSYFYLDRAARALPALAPVDDRAP